MNEKLEEFVREVDHSVMPLEKKLAAITLVQRILNGERPARVLAELAEPLGLTRDTIMRHVIPERTTRH